MSKFDNETLEERRARARARMNGGEQHDHGGAAGADDDVDDGEMSAAEIAATNRAHLGITDAEAGITDMPLYTLELTAEQLLSDDWVEIAQKLRALLKEARLDRANQAATMVPAEVHESGWQWRPTSGDSAFAPPFGTIRMCRGCGCLVAGGPTVCQRCAELP